MKKKQKINKVVNYGEWVLLGLTALFLCFLFAVRERPAPERTLTVRTRPPSALPGRKSATSDAEPVPDTSDSAAPVESDSVSANAHAQPDGVSENAPVLSDSAGLVNINTADLPALCALPGIGESLAGRVIAYREEHGPFERPEDIMNVSGIGQGKFTAIQGLITAE